MAIRRDERPGRPVARDIEGLRASLAAVLQALSDVPRSVEALIDELAHEDFLLISQQVAAERVLDEVLPGWAEARSDLEALQGLVSHFAPTVAPAGLHEAVVRLELPPGRRHEAEALAHLCLRRRHRSEGLATLWRPVGLGWRAHPADVGAGRVHLGVERVADVAGGERLVALFVHELAWAEWLAGAEWRAAGHTLTVRLPGLEQPEPPALLEAPLRLPHPQPRLRPPHDDRLLWVELPPGDRFQLEISHPHPPPASHPRITAGCTRLRNVVPAHDTVAVTDIDAEVALAASTLAVRSVVDSAGVHYFDEALLFEAGASYRRIASDRLAFRWNRGQAPTRLEIHTDRISPLVGEAGALEAQASWVDTVEVLAPFRAVLGSEDDGLAWLARRLRGRPPCATVEDLEAVLRADPLIGSALTGVRSRLRPEAGPPSEIFQSDQGVVAHPTLVREVTVTLNARTPGVRRWLQGAHRARLEAHLRAHLGAALPPAAAVELRIEAS